MSDITPDSRQLKSYVWHDGKCFFVSTIERDSSAAACQSRYNETMVWEYDWEKRETGKILYQDGYGRNNPDGHFFVCRNIYTTGKCETDEE